MNYLEYYHLLNKNQFLTPIWRDVVNIINEEIKDFRESDEVLKFFTNLFFFS